MSLLERCLAGLTALLLTTSVCAPRAAAAGWTELSSSVDVDLRANAFHIEQSWVVTGASLPELHQAVRHVTLSGRYGMYGDRQLIRTEIPEELQNYGEGVSAWAHPILVPAVLGARAGTVPTATGFRASMSGGVLGRGESEVVFTQLEPGRVRIRERGTYTLARLSTGQPLADISFRLGAATFGRVPLALAHKTMGALHNRMFNAAEALVNWLNDRRAPGRNID